MRKGIVYVYVSFICFVCVSTLFFLLNLLGFYYSSYYFLFCFFLFILCVLGLLWSLKSRFVYFFVAFFGVAFCLIVLLCSLCALPLRFCCNGLMERRHVVGVFCVFLPVWCLCIRLVTVTVLRFDGFVLPLSSCPCVCEISVCGVGFCVRRHYNRYMLICTNRMSSDCVISGEFVCSILDWGKRGKADGIIASPIFLFKVQRRPACGAAPGQNLYRAHCPRL